jgi:hypothetical protein
VTSQIILDAGALIALERADRSMWLRYERAVRTGERLVTHAGVVGQVFRGGPRQAGLGRALAGVNVASLDDRLGREAGRLLARTKTRDVIDAALVLLARDGDTILTSDLADIRPLASAAGIDLDLVLV